MDAAPFPEGVGTVLLRYDCWNLCVRSFGEPSPKRPIRGVCVCVCVCVWEIGFKGPLNPELPHGLAFCARDRF